MTEIPVAKPEITFGISRNTFEWKDLSLYVVVDRITDDGKAELYFYHRNGVGDKLLHMGNANLLSSTMQREFKKALETRGLDIDWQTVLTYIARDTMQKLREGDPVIWLNSDYGIKRPEYLLHPLFVKNAVNIIYADKSSAKSLFMIFIDLIMTLGLHVADLQSEEHKVIFLDWENDATITGWQKSCLLRGLGIDEWEVPYLRCSRPLVDSIEHIRNKVNEVEADIAIIDSLGMAVGDDLNLTKPAFAFYGALRQLPVTPVIIAHTSKSIDSKRKTVYGNAYYENEARSVWEVSKEQEYGSNELTITLHHRKAPPFAGYHEPLAWRFTFDGDTTTVETALPQQDKRTAEEAPTEADAVLSILMDSDKPLKPKEIVNQSNGRIKPTHISVVIKRILEKPEYNIHRTLDGGYYYGDNIS